MCTVGGWKAYWLAFEGEDGVGVFFEVFGEYGLGGGRCVAVGAAKDTGELLDEIRGLGLGDALTVALRRGG